MSTYLIAQPKWAVKYYIRVDSPDNRNLCLFILIILMKMLLEDVSYSPTFLNGGYQTPFSP